MKRMLWNCIRAGCDARTLRDLLQSAITLKADRTKPFLPRLCLKPPATGWAPTITPSLANIALDGRYASPTSFNTSEAFIWVVTTPYPIAESLEAVSLLYRSELWNLKTFSIRQDRWIECALPWFEVNSFSSSSGPDPSMWEAGSRVIDEWESNVLLNL